MLVYHPQAEQCRWIFGYGSLMWRPGFEFIHQTQGRLSGYHRRLSVYSNHYRGTEEKPGLVLGLDRGGSCAGMAFEVADDKWSEVLSYVRKREMITGVYREIVKQVYREGHTQPVLAVTYAVDRKHPQCAPPLSVEDTMTFVAQGHGHSGSCADYVRNTLIHLRGMGLHDEGLERLSPALENLSGLHP